MKLPMSSRLACLLAAGALLALPGTAPAGAEDGWQQVGGDSRSGVSGLAYESRAGVADGAAVGTSLLAVHDNKRTGQQRLSRIIHRQGSDDIAPLVWDGPEPVDLEAIEAVPGEPGEYVALTGRGIVYRLRVTGTTATVLDYSPLPAIGAGDDYESFALVSGHGKLAALWADRGAGADRPAPLTFASWGQPQFGTVTKRPYRAPYPTDEGARHISDISVPGSGRILVSSAADAGDDGPFASAVSDAGRVTVAESGRVRVTLDPSPAVLGTFPGRKTEALECLPGTADAVLGTDGENLGGYLRTVPLCGE